MEKEIIEHLKELKNYLLVDLIIFFVIGVTALYFSKDIILYLISSLGIDISKLIVITPFEGIGLMLKISAMISLLITFPMIIYSLLKYSKECFDNKIYKNVLSIIFFSYLLILVGIYFGVFIFSKMVLIDMVSYSIVNMQWTLSSVIGLVIQSAFIFAMFFQIILIIPLLVWTKIIKVEYLTNKKVRAVSFIVILILSGILSPLNFWSMLVMAIPIYTSYELGILISKLNNRRSKVC